MGMKKAALLSILVVAVLLAVAVIAEAQQPMKIRRIGFVSASGDANTPGPLVEAFRQKLRDLGYIEGKNILVEYRYAEGDFDRVPGLVAEVVRLKVDVLVATFSAAIRAAKQTTKTIPIVMVTLQDPVATGIVDSLARPGGNITGLTRLGRDLSEKRLELLTEVVPGTSRVGVLLDTGHTWARDRFEKIRGCGARSKNTDSIPRSTRSEPRFGGGISSCGQAPGECADHDYESCAQ
jgi:putative tryptophan/tyrosine transport system substrate-binding protein